MTTQTEINNPSKRLRIILLFVFVVFWLTLSINPVDTTMWIVENILMFAGLIFIIKSGNSLNLSSASYVFIFLFFILQTIGAHYTYSLVPWGFEVQDYFNLSRNHYDRLVHFSFGLLLVIPVKEYLSTHIIIKNKTIFSLILIFIFLGIGGLYEVIEWIYALIDDGENATNFLGEQGDKWDSQQDMALAGLGALIALVLHTMYGKKPHISGKI
jgi:putative membrane protein